MEQLIITLVEEAIGPLGPQEVARLRSAIRDPRFRRAVEEKIAPVWEIKTPGETPG